jgi:hypothetical protein
LPLGPRQGRGVAAAKPFAQGLPYGVWLHSDVSRPLRIPPYEAGRPAQELHMSRASAQPRVADPSVEPEPTQVADGRAEQIAVGDPLEAGDQFEPEQRRVQQRRSRGRSTGSRKVL